MSTATIDQYADRAAVEYVAHGMYDEAYEVLMAGVSLLQAETDEAWLRFLKALGPLVKVRALSEAV